MDPMQPGPMDQPRMNQPTQSPQMGGARMNMARARQANPGGGMGYGPMQGMGAPRRPMMGQRPPMRPPMQQQGPPMQQMAPQGVQPPAQWNRPDVAMEQSGPYVDRPRPNFPARQFSRDVGVSDPARLQAMQQIQQAKMGQMQGGLGGAQMIPEDYYQAMRMTPFGG